MPNVLIFPLLYKRFVDGQGFAAAFPLCRQHDTGGFRGNLLKTELPFSALEFKKEAVGIQGHFIAVAIA